MDVLTATQWQEIDTLLFTDNFFLAMKRYREITAASINAAYEALVGREQYLLTLSPERFKSEAEYRREAYNRLESIQSKIVVIEGSWDIDSHGPCIDLSAITEEPSQRHPKYTNYWLHSVRGFERQVEQAIEFGTELAEATGVEFYLTDTNALDINYEKRWWDEHR